MRGDFEGLCCVVTGGTGALGTAVVAHLLDAGAEVHVPCVLEEERDRFGLADHERVHLDFPVELTDESAVAAFYSGLEPLWASVHIAGGFAFTPIAELRAVDVDAQMRMNVSTCLLCCREAAARMRDGAWARGCAGAAAAGGAARPSRLLQS